MTLVNNNNDKYPKFKVGDYEGISNYKNIFAKGYTPNLSDKVFVLKKVKSTVPWTYVISDLNGEEIVGTFCEKELRKTNQEEFRIEKIIKEIEIGYMSNGKAKIILLIAGFIKKTLRKIGQYFPKPYSCFGENVKVELDLSNYATKAGL